MMKRILIQRSQSQLFETIVHCLEKRFDLILANDETMGEELADTNSEVAGIVLFHLSEKTLRTCKLARNERFSDPSIPIAVIGDISTVHPMPFGCVRFDRSSVQQVEDFLSRPIEIRVLVVEDDKAILEVASMSLSKYMDVETATDGDQAIDQVNANSFDLVVLDVMIPGSSSDDVLELIVKTFPSTAVVVMTAFDTQSIESRFTLGGAVEYIKKPFHSNTVFKAAVYGCDTCSLGKLRLRQD